MQVATIKAAVRKRDGNRCVECGMNESSHFESFGQRLHVHRLSPGAPYEASGCVTLCRKCHITKPGWGRPGRGIPTVLVRIDADLAHMVRVITAATGISLPEFLSKHLRQIVEREFQKVAKDIPSIPQRYERDKDDDKE